MFIFVWRYLWKYTTLIRLSTLCKSWTIHATLTNKRLEQRGLVTLSSHYAKVHLPTTGWTAAYGTVCAVVWEGRKPWRLAPTRSRGVLTVRDTRGHAPYARCFDNAGRAGEWLPHVRQYGFIVFVGDVPLRVPFSIDDGFPFKHR